MIELRTDQDFLEQLAADHFDSGRDATAADIRAAADDIRNLRDHSTSLEKEIERLKTEVTNTNNETIKAHFKNGEVEKQLSSGRTFLFDLIKSDVERLILKEVKSQIELELDYSISCLEDRIDSLESDVADLNEGGADDIKDTVKEMIRDGDITVNIDHM